MKAVISDIHGNLPALQAVLNEIDRLNCSEIIFLGDAVGYYIQGNECIELLRERNVHHILGNHDSYMLHDAICPRSKKVTETLEFQRRIITDENLLWLKEGKDFLVFGSDYFTHGGWNNYLEEYLYEITDVKLPFEGKRFFSGHTHVQILGHVGTKTYCNPGSVGQPRDGNPKAAFAIIDDNNEIILHRVEYEIEKTVLEMKKAGFTENFYQNLYLGAQINNRIDKITFISKI